MRFDLIDLKLFLQVVEAASITHGAERSGLALASASARIRGMEDTLGTPLLERTRRGVQPTPAGQALVHHARLVLAQMERMRGELAEYAHGVKGHVRLLCNTAALSEFLPAALAGFLSRHPHVNIDLEEKLSVEIVQAIAAGAADVGIVADSVDTGGLETHLFRRDRLVLITDRAHPLAGRRSLAFAETLGCDYVGLVEGSALQTHLAGHAARAGLPLRYRVRLRGFDAVCRMVERGVGIAVVPDTAAVRCRRSMALKRIPLTDGWAERSLLLCVRSLADVSAHARHLVAALQAD